MKRWGSTSNRQPWLVIHTARLYAMNTRNRVDPGTTATDTVAKIYFWMNAFYTEVALNVKLRIWRTSAKREQPSPIWFSTLECIYSTRMHIKVCMRNIKLNIMYSIYQTTKRVMMPDTPPWKYMVSRAAPYIRPIWEGMHLKEYQPLWSLSAFTMNEPHTRTLTCYADKERKLRSATSPPWRIKSLAPCSKTRQT